MSAKCFVDTNILFYAQDRSAGLKHERAAKIVNDLWQSATGVLSTQVLQEFCVAVRRVDRNRAIEDLRQWVKRYSDWEIVVNTSESKPRIAIPNFLLGCADRARSASRSYRCFIH
jgi:predicted nucleic acid-binding protein